jgi:hypothetical protein
MAVYEKKMTIFVTTPGDRSTGSPPGHLEIDLGNCIHLADEGDNRERTREALRQCFNTLLEEPTGVRFDDECVECGTIGCKGDCMDRSLEGEILRAIGPAPAHTGRSQIMKKVKFPELELHAALQSLVAQGKLRVVNGNRYQRRSNTRGK